MKAQLVARNPNEGSVTLYIEYSNNRKIKRVPTGHKVKAKFWDNTAKKIKAGGGTSVTDDNKSLTAQLDTVNALIRDFHSANGRWPLCEELSAVLTEKAAPLPTAETADTAEPAAAPVTLLHQLETFTAPRNQPRWAETTRRVFNTLAHNIEQYQTATSTTWYIETLTNQNIQDFQNWMLENKEYKNASLGKYVQKFRQFLQEAEAQAVNLKRVKPLHTQMLSTPTVIYKSEIEALRALDLSGNKRLRQVRDLQQIQIFSGLRFSDLMSLKAHHLSNGVITIRMQKTKQTVVIPIFPQLAETIAAYKNPETGELQLPTISNVKFNQYVKELCALIPDLHKVVHIEEKVREEYVTTTAPKYTLITSHSSRRSFVSLCLDLGFQAKQVMQWSGHRTLAAFQRYMGRTETAPDVANIFAAAYAAK